MMLIQQDGAARMYFKAPPGMHRVPDEAIGASLAFQLDSHVGTDWLAAVILADGRGVMRTSHSAVAWPGKDTLALVTGIAIAINQREAREGHWVVGFDAKERDLFALWRDNDGDAHAFWSIGEPATVLDWTEINFAAQAAAALDETKRRQRDVGVTNRQMRRRALARHRYDA